MGITGKDVLLEQSDRNVYELLDLGFGALPHGRRRAARAATRRLEALRRLGRVRIATKYPRIAERALRRHRPPGRDRRGEGIGRAGAADRAGRRHRRPDRHGHGRWPRTASRCARRSRDCTARLIANPVAHKLKAAEIDALVERMRCADEDRALAETPRAARAAAARRTCAEDVRRDRAAVRTGGDDAVLELTERFDRAELAPRAAARRPRELEGALGVLEPDVLEACSWRSRTSARSPRRSCASRPRWSCPRASGSRSPRSRCARAGVYVPGGRAAVPVDGRDVRGHGARGRGRRDRGLRAAAARRRARTR